MTDFQNCCNQRAGATPALFYRVQQFTVVLPRFLDIPQQLARAPANIIHRDPIAKPGKSANSISRLPREFVSQF